jgi:hypothetical protein
LAEGEHPLTFGNTMLAPSTIFTRCLCSSSGGDAQELDLMAEKRDDGTSTAGQALASRERPDAAAERRKEGGQSREGTDPSVLTPGGNVRYGGGNAQGVPMAPDSKDDK